MNDSIERPSQRTAVPKRVSRSSGNLTPAEVTGTFCLQYYMCFLQTRRRLRLLDTPVSARALCVLRCFFAGVLLAACADSPTTPRAFVHPADGELWVAVTVPPGLPELDAWLPYLRSIGSEEEAAAVRQVAELRREADQARLAGQLRSARALNDQAARIAVISLRRMPEPAVLDRSLEAIDLWLRRARSEVDLGRFPVLAGAVEEVSAARSRAVRGLAAGDTSSAVLHIATGAEAIRDQSPAAVALRVLERAEERLRRHPQQSREIDRALHLVYTSREALLSGDPGRALRRALYALQLAEPGALRGHEDLPEPSR